MCNARMLVIANLLAAICLSTPALAGDDPPPPTRPHRGGLGPLSKQQVVTRMKDLLRQVGDLSAYIASVDDQGTITLDLHPVLKTSCTKHGIATSCSGAPPKTTFGKPIEKDALGRVEQVLERVNQSLAGGAPLDIRTP